MGYFAVRKTPEYAAMLSVILSYSPKWRNVPGIYFIQEIQLKKENLIKNEAVNHGKFEVNN